MPTTTTPFYLSKTLWTNLILAATAIFVPSVNAWITANPSLVAVVWSGINMVLRLITKDAVSLT